MSKKKSNGFIRYTNYNFVDKDPVIDVLRTMKRDVGMTDSELAASSNVSVGTIKNWFGGKTKRPAFATAAAVATTMGFDSIPITAEARQKLRATLKE